MNKEIFEKELEKITAISKEFGVEKVLLFGSCLDDIETAQDIDIAVSGIMSKDFFKYYGKVTLNVMSEVDIIDLDDTMEHFRKRILSKARIIYERTV